MADTPNLGLPLIDGNMTADVPRDHNALANALDTAIGNMRGVPTTSKEVAGAIAELHGDAAAHEADYVRQPGYAAATGAANVYAVALTPAPAAYSEGMAVAVKINLDNTGAATINVNSLGAIAVKKANGNDVAAGNLKAGSVYSLRYNGTAFILQGEGGEYGTAGAAQVLTGYSIGTESGIVAGSMPNQGAKTLTPGPADVAIPDGYHNGAGKVPAVFVPAGNVLVGTTIAGTAGTMPDNGPTAAETVNLTNQNQEYTIALGKHSGLRKIKTAITGLVAGVIKAGTTVGGILGTFTSDATATAARILTGYSAYVNGNKIDGTMPDRGAVTITPSSVDQTITNGYHNGAGKVSKVTVPTANVLAGTTIAGQAGTMPNRAGDTAALASSVSGTTLKLRASNGYRDGVNDNVTITDADFIAENIRLDKDVLGIVGTYTGDNIKSIQQGLIAKDTFVITVPISAVDMNSSIVRCHYKAPADNWNFSMCASSLTSSTSITIRTSSQTGSNNVSWEVIEFKNVKSVQRGTASYGDVTINSVNISKSMIFVETYSSSSTSSASGFTYFCSFNSSTQFRIESAYTSSITYYWQVIEFN